MGAFIMAHWITWRIYKAAAYRQLKVSFAIGSGFAPNAVPWFYCKFSGAGTWQCGLEFLIPRGLNSSVYFQRHRGHIVQRQLCLRPKCRRRNIYRCHNRNGRLLKEGMLMPHLIKSWFVRRCIPATNTFDDKQTAQRLRIKTSPLLVVVHLAESCPPVHDIAQSITSSALAEKRIFVLKE